MSLCFWLPNYWTTPDFKTNLYAGKHLPICQGQDIAYYWGSAAFTHKTWRTWKRHSWWNLILKLWYMTLNHCTSATYRTVYHSLYGNLAPCSTQEGTAFNACWITNCIPKSVMDFLQSFSYFSLLIVKI